MRCYSLNNLILASYSPSCISNAALAESFPRLPLDWSFSVFPNLQLSTLDLPSFLSPLAATLMDLPASVANKRLTAWLSSLDATLTKNRRGGGCYCPSWSHLHTGTLPRPISFVCHSYENCRVCTQSSRSGRGVYSQRSNAHFASRMALRDVQPSNLQTILPSHCSARPLVPQLAKVHEILPDPGKQLRSPRCLRIVSGHRGQFDLGPLRKSCLGPAF